MEVRGLRVLVVEDDGMIAMLLKNMLTAMGCEVAGSATRVTEALGKINSIAYDVVLLDVNLAGTMSYPVAAALRERGKPFIFATSYGVAALPEGMRDVPLLSKPYVLLQVREALLAVAG